jgi:hypothetical protein
LLICYKFEEEGYVDKKLRNRSFGSLEGRRMEYWGYWGRKRSTRT